jgi:type I restriction enzyme R subunit
LAGLTVNVGDLEARTQRRVVRLFTDTLKYDYLGDWRDRPGNSNVEERLVRQWLAKTGHDDATTERVLRELRLRAAVHGTRRLYDANQDVHGTLRYGVKLRRDVGEPTETIRLIDWTDPEQNEFAVAEEVTIAGEHEKRPDVVLYVNGIALGILELKRSVVAVSEGIRQNIGNQKKLFIQPFFSTVQLVMAGNDTEGLRYGVIGTPERYYQAWKEPGEIENPLDRALVQLCSKRRLLELVHDFIVFDAGTKKIARHNQYFGVKAAQERVARREGGIIWHTQGSGKSLTMVFLARWILEHVTDSRVLIITDREELDEQIHERVFTPVGEKIRRTRSGADLIKVLAGAEHNLICSLIHKFGASDDGDIEEFVEELKIGAGTGFKAHGDIYAFVDECHRTQSGKLHKAMEDLLPGATFIGFTGTPLLKADKRRSTETFGSYIHTYKYDEAVADRAVLDLRYLARDIDQTITSQEKIDQWFDARTSGLTDHAKAQLKRRWGTMQHVLSSQDRLRKIANDILFDMATKDRLSSGRGNAMLVCGTIYEACRVYEMFQKTELAGRCAIVTSYRPSAGDIKLEDAGEGETQKAEQFEIYRRMLAEYFDKPEDEALGKIEEFEQDVKKRFIEEPGQMKLLIVVDKLLTGFDAPSATYLYIDKEMRDHGLFQAVCRVNRLDTDDKEYGYIVDYRDLFHSLERSVKDYTAGAFEGYDAGDVSGLLKDWLVDGRERLEKMREAVKALCEPVEPPRDTRAYLRYFCGSGGDADALRETEPRRVALYKMVASLLRAYSAMANDLPAAGYSAAEAEAIKAEVTHYENVRMEVKLASGDYIDMKVFEPAMRHLLDSYIRASDSEKVSAFDEMTLVELFVKEGEGALDALPDGLKGDHEAMAETIENNVRRVIIQESAVNPKYYAKMSELLDALVKERREKALEYKAYLARVGELMKQVQRPDEHAKYPPTIDSPARRALYDNLDRNEDVAVGVDKAIRGVKKDGWRDNEIKRREVRGAIRRALELILGRAEPELVETTFELAKSQRDY